MLIIYFRACEKQETISYVDRYKFTDKKILLRKCWKSLQSGVSKKDKIIVIYDAVSTETLEFMKNTSRTEDISFVAVPEHPWEYHEHTVVAIQYLKLYAKKYPDELHYLVEDDYLHMPLAVDKLKANLTDCPYFAVPYDYPDRYARPEPSMIILGRDRHWRTISSSTMTVIALGKTWLMYIDKLVAAAPTSNDKVFEEIYKNHACISPIPALASHMTAYHQSPLINWDGIYEDTDIEDY